MATKLVSTARLSRFLYQLQLRFAPLSSPAFTGTPTAPTAVVGTDTDQIATTAYVLEAVSGQVGDYIPTGAKGNANGVCPLNNSAQIDSQYLPSFVDDVIEGYPVSGATELSAGWLSLTNGGSAFTPETGKIYVLVADSANYTTNAQFRWSGSTYVEIIGGGYTLATDADIDAIFA